MSIKLLLNWIRFAGALGVNMAEYVLGGSPMAKEMDARLRGMKPFVNRGMVSPLQVVFFVIRRRKF